MVGKRVASAAPVFRRDLARPFRDWAAACRRTQRLTVGVERNAGRRSRRNCRLARRRSGLRHGPWSGGLLHVRLFNLGGVFEVKHFSLRGCLRLAGSGAVYGVASAEVLGKRRKVQGDAVWRRQGPGMKAPIGLHFSPSPERLVETQERGHDGGADDGSFTSDVSLPRQPSPPCRPPAPDPYSPTYHRRLG